MVERSEDRPAEIGNPPQYAENQNSNEKVLPHHNPFVQSASPRDLRGRSFSNTVVLL